MVVTRSDGLYPGKSLYLAMIAGNKVEILLSDTATGGERCYFPHTPAQQALERGFGILAALDWPSEVKQFRNPIEWISRRILGRPTPP